MVTRRALRTDEVVVVAVTPAARGLSGPMLATSAPLATLIAVAQLWQWPHQHVWLLSIVLLFPAIILVVRLVRWRSNRLTITNQRIIEESGITERRQSSYEFDSIERVHVQQGFLERVTRRGFVTVDLPTGSVTLDRVRHPDALIRVIERQRQPPSEGSPHAVTNSVTNTVTPAEPLDLAIDAGLFADDESDPRWRHLFGPDGPRAS